LPIIFSLEYYCPPEYIPVANSQYGLFVRNA